MIIETTLGFKHGVAKRGKFFFTETTNLFLSSCSVKALYFTLRSDSFKKTDHIFKICCRVLFVSDLCESWLNSYLEETRGKVVWRQFQQTINKCLTICEGEQLEGDELISCLSNKWLNLAFINNYNSTCKPYWRFIDHLLAVSIQKVLVLLYGGIKFCTSRLVKTNVGDNKLEHVISLLWSKDNHSSKTSQAEITFSLLYHWKKS